MYILNFIRGFCMALAESVPGVSGGTVAFILGFYDSFVNALHNLISKDKIKRLKALKYLSKIGIGWVVGFILSVLLKIRIQNVKLNKFKIIKIHPYGCIFCRQI